MKIFYVFIGLSCLQLTQAQTLRAILKPIADSYLDEANPTANLGTTRTLFVGPQGSTGTNMDVVSLVKFNVVRGNIHGVPWRSSITAAFLNLYPVAKRAASISVFRAKSPDFSPETENTVTWSSGWDGDLAVTSAHFDTTSGCYRFDVSSIVQSWFSGTSTDYNGFLIAGPQDQGSENTFVTLHSRESSYPPELVILYDPPPPTWKPFDRSTIILQAACGLGEAALCLVSGYAAGNASSIGGSVVLAMVSTITLIALPWVIYYPAEEMGGNGSFFWTLAGCVAGGSVAILSLWSTSGQLSTPVAVVTAILAVGGGIFGYHYFGAPMYEADPHSSLNFHQLENSLSHKLQTSAVHSFRMTLISITF